jgi:hypothetical protein
MTKHAPSKHGVGVKQVGGDGVMVSMFVTTKSCETGIE